MRGSPATPMQRPGLGHDEVLGACDILRLGRCGCSEGPPDKDFVRSRRTGGRNFADLGTRHMDRAAMMKHVRFAGFDLRAGRSQSSLRAKRDDLSEGRIHPWRVDQRHADHTS